jgi:hypothetical protein
VAQQQIGEQGEVRVVVETRQGIGPALDQLGPDFRPVLVPDQREKAEPHDPVHVGRAETADGQHVLDCPGFPLQTQNAVFVGRLGHDLLVVIDPRDEAFQPIARLGGQDGGAALRPAAEVEDA